MIYIASPFFNEEQLAFVRSIENVFEENGIDYFSPRSEGVLMDMEEEDRQVTKTEIYLSNIENISECEVMIAVIDGRDVGTIWEMGFAAALGKRIISISNEGHGLNVMLAESVQAHIDNVGDIVKAIMDPMYEGMLVTGVY